MEFPSPEVRACYDALLAVAERTLIAFDFDGTLAPIVDDPAAATMLPGAAEVLEALGSGVAAMAVITGRQARHVLHIGGFEALGDRFEAMGKELYIFGQYGSEQWSSSNRQIVSPLPPPGLATFMLELPALLRAHDAADAFIEEKGIAVSIHTRRMADPEAAYERVVDPIRLIAHQYHLHVETGRMLIEVRGSGMDKGMVLRELLDRLGAQGLLLAGDDRGDIEAFRAARAWQEEAGGRPYLISTEVEGDPVLGPWADQVLAGPPGLVDFLREFAADVASLGEH